MMIYRPCMLSTARRNRLLWVLACGLWLASAYHLLAIVWPKLDPSSSGARHAVFVGVDAVLGFCIGLRPKGFFWVFAALSVQQLCSHGQALWRALAREHRLDWASLVVIVAMPLITWLLWCDRQRRNAPQ